MEKVIVLTGPTGIGKTDLSLMIAKKFNMEIINCDASQFKKDLLIGTGKYDTLGTDIKHHLFDIIDASDNYSIKDFKNSAKSLITDITKRSKMPLIVGGTGLYINSLLYDYSLDSDGRTTATEEKYLNYSNDELHELLTKYDEALASVIHKNNRRRVLRAIERIENGESIVNNDTKLAYDSLVIVLNTDRETLYNRINKRVDAMIDSGWVSECQMLKEKYDVSKIKDIGYQELFAYLDGKISLEEAKDLIKQKTRNYAKRQLTWFRNKLAHVEVEMDYNDINNTFNTIVNLCNDFINK